MERWVKSIQKGENTALMQVNQLCLSSNEVVYILKVVRTILYEASMVTKAFTSPGRLCLMTGDIIGLIPKGCRNRTLAP